MNVSVVEVRMWGKRVGAVAEDPRYRAYTFSYAPEWRKTGIELAPRMMPLDSSQTAFVFPALAKESFKGLPGLLADALPDDFGNALVNAWMADKGIQPSQVTALDRLSYMAKRGLGALEFKPGQGPRSESKEPLQMAKLVEVARSAMQGSISHDPHARAALAQMIRVGTSAPGARAKAVIAWNPKTHEIRSGQFDVDRGFEHWLLKFDGVGVDLELGTSLDYGRIEYAYHLMARAAKIEMSPCRLLEENGRAHFMTKRFDRDGNLKHHMQSLCAMEHLDFRQRATHAYSQLFMTIDALGCGPRAMEQAFRRMAFNVMARNCDDHTKNFNFLLKQGGRWELSPAFDITHAHNPSGKWTAQHLMSVNGKFDGITRADLLAEADKYSIPRRKEILEEIKEAVSRWESFAKKAKVGASEVRRVQADFQVV